MRYYVLYVSKAPAEDRQTFGFDTRDEAIQKYHSLMSSAMAGSIINYVMISVMNSAGGLEIPVDVWERKTTQE